MIHANPRLWADREFVFDFPAEHYPNLIARLAGTPARLEELVQGLAPSILTSRRDGKWSIQENAGHLIDLERLADQRLDEFLAGADALSPADLANPDTENARYNTRPLAEILTGFRAARTAWVRRLDALSSEQFARRALHPRLQQPFRLVDHLAFFAEHDDHHLARIRSLRGA